MNFRIVARYLGGLLVFFTLSTFLSFAWSYWFHEEAMMKAFYGTWALGFGFGGILVLLGRKSHEGFFIREGIAIVSLGWILCALLAAMPFYLSGVIPLFVDAFFESMSGLTTTGATILPHIDSLPRGFLFWRSFIQWVGGMGIIVLFIAVLPALGVGGKYLYRLEVPGVSKEGPKPQIREAASILWKLYIVLSILEVIALKFCNMSFFDAFCHTFTTMATGGFSNHDKSIAHFQSFRIEMVISVFMFLAGINFTLYYFLLRGPRKNIWKNSELRSYVIILLVSIVFFMGFLIFQSGSTSSWTFWPALRHSTFQAISILTTTGFTTDDFSFWSSSAQLLFIGLMFCGACAGSTGGGMKVFRVMVCFKTVHLGILRFFRPRVVRSVHFGNEPITDEILASISRFFLLFVSIFFICSLFMAFLGLDLVTATSSVIACMGNIGPGLGMVGPSHTYAFLPDSGKVLLSLCMMLGRLELYAVLVILMPEFWKKA